MGGSTAATSTVVGACGALALALTSGCLVSAETLLTPTDGATVDGTFVNDAGDATVASEARDAQGSHESSTHLDRSAQDARLDGARAPGEVGTDAAVRDGGDAAPSVCVPDAGACPYASCEAILRAIPTTTSGVYTIEVAAFGAFTVYCDMTNDGGGWTLVARFNNQGDNQLDTTDDYHAPPAPTGVSAKISHAKIQALVHGSTLTNPVKIEFPEASVERYIWNQCSWTTAANRNLCASWALDPDTTTHLTYCGTPDDPTLNSGNGGEWASNAIPWPYQDGTCMCNGGFATDPGCVGSGNGDAWSNVSAWSPETGLSTTGRFTVNLWVK